MCDLFWLSDEQLANMKPFFPRSHGVPRVDDRRVISAIVFVLRGGGRWRDTPGEYGPHKTLYNRFMRWSRLGVFDKIFSQLTARGGARRVIRHFACSKHFYCRRCRPPRCMRAWPSRD